MGNKNSGRRPLKDEAIQIFVINESWQILSGILLDEKTTPAQKQTIALEIAKKSCPKEINLKGDVLKTNVYAVIGQLQRDFQENRLSPLVLDTGDGNNKR